ncbi:hypothetical protein STCU_10886 [Strigomonas culicis]|uniref:Uncharacterized protein n=1 Tax=Strigomonas culicis TaxID=28005 RepID=S9TFX0_9TRYP|nr:hypothetical protein STCU_10886 [Strigomonas culicis]|eukprot:EPY16967.1 hypothetical protein STCU_10886 [Strigomonas culicis]
MDLFSRKDYSAVAKLKSSFQGHFVILFVAEGAPAPREEVVSFVETYSRRACEQNTGATPATSEPLVHIVSHESGTLLLLNLEGLKGCCSVLQAFKVELAVGALLSTLNVSLSRVTLGVIPGPLPESILWPSESCPDAHTFSANQYWVHPSTSDITGVALAMHSRGDEKNANEQIENRIYILSEIVL